MGFSVGRAPQLDRSESAWGQVVAPTGMQAPGEHKAQPLIKTAQRIRAQIGTRPVQMTPPGNAGQSGGQRAGFVVGPPGLTGGSFDRLFHTGARTAPNMIVRFFRAANTGYSGYGSIGRAANGITGGTGDNFTILKRPLMRFPTRGARSISGAMNPKARWDDVGRIPSVFVPTTPLR